MPRSWRQIAEDAQAAADGVEKAERPLHTSEVGEALRRCGRPLTEKQVEITLARARELGLLHRQGALWARGPGNEVAAIVASAVAVPTPQLLVLCARQMLELPPSVDNSRTVRHLLDLVAQQLPRIDDVARSWAAPARHVARSDSRANGVSRNADPEVEVRLDAHS